MLGRERRQLLDRVATRATGKKGIGSRDCLIGTLVQLALRARRLLGSGAFGHLSCALRFLAGARGFFGTQTLGGFSCPFCFLERARGFDFACPRLVTHVNRRSHQVDLGGDDGMRRPVRFQHCKRIVQTAADDELASVVAFTRRFACGDTFARRRQGGAELCNSRLAAGELGYRRKRLIGLVEPLFRHRRTNACARLLQRARDAFLFLPGGLPPSLLLDFGLTPAPSVLTCERLTPCRICRGETFTHARVLRGVRRQRCRCRLHRVITCLKVVRLVRKDRLLDVAEGGNKRRQPCFQLRYLGIRLVEGPGAGQRVERARKVFAVDALGGAFE